MRAIRNSLLGMLVVSTTFAPSALAGGFVTSPDSGSRAYGGAVQSDGKPVAVGAQSGSKGDDTLAVRLQSSGAIDFSSRITLSKTSTDQGTACAVQPDGKLVIAGNAGGKMSILRLKADGSKDGSFDRDGSQTISFQAGNSGAKAVALSGSDIVAAGSAGGTAVLAKLSSSGKVLDTATIPFSGTARASAVAVQSDGKIVVAGGALSGTWAFALARYDADLTPDGSFGSGGLVTLDLAGSNHEEFFAVAIAGDGKILAAGRSMDLAGYDHWTVVRFDSNGAVDTSFGPLGSNGIVQLDFAGDFGIATGMALQADGAIVLGGEYRSLSYGGGAPRFAALRLMASGEADATFHGGTPSVIDILDTAQAKAVGLAPDGRVFLFGFASESGSYHLAVAGYLADGTPDPSFQ